MTGPLAPPEAPGPSAEEPRGERGRELDRALVSGLAWTGAARWSAQAFTWVATIILARLLTRDDYGIWTSAAVYIGVVTLLSEFGIGAAVIMLRNLSDRQIAQINGLALVTGVAAMLLSLLLAGPIAGFYRTPAIAPIVIAMSVVFVISAFRIVPASILQRDLAFRFLALANAARSVLQSVVLVGMAALGFGYWTFPVGVIAGELSWTLMVLVARRHAIAWPRIRDIREAMVFSGHIVLSRLCWYGYSNADFMIAGRVLGQTALGAYGMAWNMASVPVDKVNSIIMGVTPALFSAVQDRKDELRRYVTSLTAGISILAFPAGVGLALVADDFVGVVLGPEWTTAAAPIRLLALYAIVRSIGPILPPVLNAVGETRYVMWNNVLALILLPAAFLAGSRWGIAGVAAGWAVGHPIILFRLYRRVAQKTDLRGRDYLNALRPALHGTAVMTAVVLALIYATQGVAPAVRLPLHVTAGGASYAAVLWFYHRERLQTIRRMLRRKTAAS